VTGEIEDLPWQVRIHDRNVTQYQLHAVAAQVTG
jgi:hypothetical protein